MNYKVSEAAEKLNVSIKTLQRWDRDGVLVAHRTPTNRRYYTNEQIDNFEYVEPKKEFIPYYVVHLQDDELIDLEQYKDLQMSDTHCCAIITDKSIIGTDKNGDRIYVETLEEFIKTDMESSSHDIELDHLHIPYYEVSNTMIKMYKAGEFKLQNKDWDEDIRLLEFNAGMNLIWYYCEQIKKEYMEMQLLRGEK
jgi:hypothetical protein